MAPAGEVIHDSAPSTPATAPTPAEKPEATPPAEQPAEDTTDAEPAEEKPEADANDGFTDLESDTTNDSDLGNLTNEPAETPAETPAPAETQPDAGTPAETPAEEQQGDLGDIFDDTTSAEPPAGDEPRVANKADETIEASEEPAASDVPTGELFEETESKENVDELFDDNSAVEPRAAESAVVSVKSAEPSATVDSAPRRQLPVRQWIDNTGSFTTVGRLIGANETHVRLLKSNGRFSTVSKDRLSRSDLRYVTQVAPELGTQSLEVIALR
jgi:hypothetical protein